jgi:hypothetical protein
MRAETTTRDHDERRDGDRVCDVCGTGFMDREVYLIVDIDDPEMEAWELCTACQENVKGLQDTALVNTIRELGG